MTSTPLNPTHYHPFSSYSTFFQPGIIHDLALSDVSSNSAERQTLFNLAETIIPNFKRISKKGKFNILTRGLNSDNPEYYHTNRKISLAVQNFILKTKRFID